MNDDFDLLAAMVECAEHTSQLNDHLYHESPEETIIRRTKRRVYSATYRKKYPEKIKLRTRVTSARNRVKREADDFSSSDLAAQIKSQKGLCWWCGEPLDPNNYHVDHRIPVAKGGTNAPGNIVIAHPSCNLSKGEKLPWEYIGRLL